MPTDSFLRHNLIAGVDEAGRGAWAGPVFAAAVILSPEITINGLADSKKLSPLRRETLAKEIKASALSWSIASADADEIDRLNILQATLLAMQRAISGLDLAPKMVLVDGGHVPRLSIPAQPIVKGDDKVAAISAASILAKVERDLLMERYRKEYPDYSFHQHKGYGTARHSAELNEFGILDIHRKTFAPIRKVR